MKEERKGEITVFLSLILTLFLSLTFSLIESARIEGANMWMGYVMDMGLSSTYSRFHPGLLEEYHVFALNQLTGSIEDQVADLINSTETFMSYHLVHKQGEDHIKTNDYWKLELQQLEVETYGLLTDLQGGVFKEQVVTDYKENLGLEAIDKLLDQSKEWGKLEESEEQFKQKNQDVSSSMEEYEQQIEEIEQSKEESQEEEAGLESDSEDKISEDHQVESTNQEAKNPLDIIKEIKKMGILSLVCKNPESLSNKSIDITNVASKRPLSKGTSDYVYEDQGSQVDHLVFQEYMCQTFGNIRNPKEDRGLDYELEYLLFGKSSDIENLKSVVHRLLLLRESCNFAHLLLDREKSDQAYQLSTVLFGIFGIPGLIEVGQLALLLAWAYGESLLDVRRLLDGEKVSMMKDNQDWQLQLDRLPDLLEELKEHPSKESSSSESKKGMNYEQYLRFLLMSKNQEEYPMRCLDLIEAKIRLREETFSIDQSLVWCEIRVNYHVQSMFGGWMSLAGQGAKDGYQRMKRDTYGYGK
ncbi:MAG TPA: hypothetical protein IAC41_11280 [Candidatus Merdenecus merdavium]|nr:hypothetical protein [Candidatus Merdenecus merdavium]